MLERLGKLGTAVGSIDFCIKFIIFTLLRKIYIIKLPKIKFST